MSIEYVLTRLRVVSQGLRNGQMRLREAWEIRLQAMQDYLCWVDRITKDVKNDVMSLNREIDEHLLG